MAGSSGPALAVIVSANCGACVGIKEPANFERFKTELLKVHPDMTVHQIMISAPKARINVDLYPAGLDNYTISGWTPNFMLFNRAQWNAAWAKLGRDNRAPLNRALVMNGVIKSDGKLEQIPAKYNFKLHSDVIRWVGDVRNDPILMNVTPVTPVPSTTSGSSSASGTTAQTSQQPCFGRISGRPLPRTHYQR